MKSSFFTSIAAECSREHVKGARVLLTLSRRANEVSRGLAGCETAGVKRMGSYNEGSHASASSSSGSAGQLTQTSVISRLVAYQRRMGLA